MTSFFLCHHTTLAWKERLSLMQLEINVLKLMNEAIAIALGYGIFRRNEFNATPRNVAFMDFDHSHLSVFIAGFTKDKLTILHQIHERNLGARDLDWALFEYYSERFNKQNGLNPKKTDKLDCVCLMPLKSRERSSQPTQIQPSTLSI